VFTAGTYGYLPVLALDGAMPTAPVLSPAPPYSGDFNIKFTSPATNVSFISGYWDTVGSGIISVYDPSNILLGTYTDSTLGVDTFSFGAVVIGSIYFNSFADFAGADIDNLSFNQVPEPATMLLLGLGLIGVAGIRRKFKK